MPGEKVLQRERDGTIGDFLEAFIHVQAMGHRLADESHGELYGPVMELIELLHQARTKIELIEQISRDAKAKLYDPN